MRIERGLIAIAFIEQPLIRIGGILRDVELQATRLALEAAARVLLGQRTKFAGSVSRYPDLDKDGDHGFLDTFEIARRTPRPGEPGRRYAKPLDLRSRPRVWRPAPFAIKPSTRLATQAPDGGTA